MLLIMPSPNNTPKDSEADDSVGKPRSSAAESTSSSSSSSTSTLSAPATRKTRSTAWYHFTNFPIEDEDVQKKNSHTLVPQL